MAIPTQLRNVMLGMLTACDMEAGRDVVDPEDESDLSEYAQFFAEVFEVARRYKVMNPEKMRHTYGKLMYLLQDANAPAVQEELGFSAVVPIKTVHARLKDAGCLGLLSDDSIAVATQVPTPDRYPSVTRP